MTEYPIELDRRDALRMARLLLPEGESLVVELRAFGVSGGTSIRRGFYDDAEKLASDAVELSTCGASGVYVTPNDVSMAARRLKVRTNRHGRVTGGGSCAGNDDVSDRRWLLLDFDPVRPSGTSATEDELVTSDPASARRGRGAVGRGVARTGARGERQRGAPDV